MPVATQESDFEEIRTEDEIKKLRLEIPFARDISRFLKEVDEEFADEFAADGTIINVSDFREELRAILLTNYRKISNQFKFNVRESFDDTVSPEINAQINNEINRSMRRLSNMRSDEILRTTNGDMIAEVSIATAALIDAGEEVTNVKVATGAQKGLNERIPGRAPTIGATETQTSSELSKNIEVETLKRNDVVLGGVAIVALNERWTARFINTRQWHAAAHGQIRGSQIPGAYIVKGEILREPGDPSGSPDNIINCHCSSITFS